MAQVQNSTDLIIKPPFSNYLGGNTALYESNQTSMKGGTKSRKTKSMVFPKIHTKRHRPRGRKCACKTKRRRNKNVKR